jgi:hypothetical protein
MTILETQMEECEIENVLTVSLLFCTYYLTSLLLLLLLLVLVLVLIITIYVYLLIFMIKTDF